MGIEDNIYTIRFETRSIKYNKDNKTSNFLIIPLNKTKYAIFLSKGNDYTFYWSGETPVDETIINIFNIIKNKENNDYGRIIDYSHTSAWVLRTQNNTINYIIKLFDTTIFLLVDYNGNVLKVIQPKTSEIIHYFLNST